MPTITVTTRVWATFLMLAGSLYLGFQKQAPSPSAPQTSTQEGLQLLHKMQAALGGAERIASINEYEETVRAETWNNSGVPLGEVRKRTRWMRNPNVLRLDQIGPRDTYVLYFDGASGSGWEILPDLKGSDTFKTAGEAIELVGGELQFAKNYLSGFQFNAWLADRIAGNVITSPAPNVLRIGGSDTTLDPVTGLPMKTASVSLADPSRPVSQEMRYERWTEFAGVRFPTQRANYHNGVKLAQETTEGAIRINAGLTPQSLAAKPADFAPDLPRR